jgi:hypothetical protein
MVEDLESFKVQLELKLNNLIKDKDKDKTLSKDL